MMSCTSVSLLHKWTMSTSLASKAEKAYTWSFDVIIDLVVKCTGEVSNEDRFTINIPHFEMQWHWNIATFSEPIFLHTSIIGSCCVAQKHFSLQCSLVVVVVVVVAVVVVAAAESFAL